jgi:GntR family colanic acid and biofilm gene transcriptional regulator
MIENMWTSMGPVLAAYYRGSKSGYDSGHGHHDAMLKALKAGDGARAAAALEDGILSAAPSIEQFLREHEERASTQVLAAA